MPTLVDPPSSVLHPTMDDEEMAEIHSIVEQHDMEWNDTVNLVTSAWWSKFLKKMEGGVEESRDGGERDDLHAIGEIFDVPPCFYEGFGLENKENNFMEQHLCDNYRNEDYSEDALPRLEIGEIDGWEGEWLS
ncbi:uncharacterized protein LOC109707239 [Ananas comosus]|uniref:Uncharacterized protein LOC109707239 n=1 Tax=Ananas comosus TaxID=4615 RepID=A0A6P5EK89_ANACO|nr:uncharacterized protein LOC109707239 [Ananas comosus]